MIIKQKIIKLCDDMIAFWQKLKEEVEMISSENDMKIICKWDSFFEDNYKSIGELSDVKKYIDICRNSYRL